MDVYRSTLTLFLYLTTLVKKLKNFQSKMGAKEIFQNQMSAKGCKWSSLTVQSTGNPLSFLLCHHFKQLLLLSDIDRLDVLPPQSERQR